MGYCIEYLIDLTPPRAREWLSPLEGFWVDRETDDHIPFAELKWGGLSLFADFGPTACLARVPSLNYSWLIADHLPAVEHIARLEEWLCTTLPGVRAIRVDELLFGEWQRETEREWYEWPDPVRGLYKWLLTSEWGDDPRYFRLLPDEQSHIDRQTIADEGS